MVLRFMTTLQIFKILIHTRKKLLEQAHKSTYALYKKIKNISIPVDLQLKLFITLGAEVLLFASEIWGFENKNSIERVDLQFL